MINEKRGDVKANPGGQFGGIIVFAGGRRAVPASPDAKKSDGKKNLPPLYDRKSRQAPLHLFHGNGAHGANLDAALAAETLIHIDRLGFAVFDLKHAGRAGIHALPLAVTLALIHLHLIHILFSPPSR
jgi:hypothetical protein